MNILSNQQQETLLLQFPKNIKLSYEKVIHNKVYESTNDKNHINQDQILMAIPKGRKAFFWFHQGNVYLMKLSMNGGNQIESVQKLNEFNSSSLLFVSEFNGSVFYGTFTFLSQLKKQMISIEDVFYYKNENVSHQFLIHKLKWIHELLQMTNQCSTRIVWGLPILRKTQQDIVEKIQEVQGQMTIYCILIRSLKENKPSSKVIYANFLEKPQIEKPVEIHKDEKQPIKKENLFKVNLKPTPTNCVQTKSFPKMRFFNVKADLQNDIYHLYEDDKYIDVAYIPDYKTSVMMNRLFRNIKENENLDALEESDDEEEFENDKEDRFVDLEKVLKMQCYFHSKFRKWVPL
jgi:hypothetical protein